MAENPTFQIPRDVIEPIIQAHVTSAVANALGDNQRILSAAIATVLNQKVREDGEPDKYGYRDSVTFMQWLVGSSIRKAVKAAVEEEVAKNGEAIKKAIAQELRNSKSPLVKQLVEGMVGAMTNPDALKYRLTVTYAENK